jgi:sialidase-1
VEDEGCAHLLDARSDRNHPLLIPFARGNLAVAWAYDPSTQRTEPSVFAMAPVKDGDFSSPLPTGFQAEACEILSLGGHEVLAVYRRVDQPGLWAETGRIEDGAWTTGGAVPLWQGAGSHMTGRTDSADALSGLKFGSPSMRQMEEDSVLVLFWCQEDGVTGIRWLRLQVG